MSVLVTNVGVLVYLEWLGVRLCHAFLARSDTRRVQPHIGRLLPKAHLPNVACIRTSPPDLSHDPFNLYPRIPERLDIFARGQLGQESRVS